MKYATGLRQLSLFCVGVAILTVCISNDALAQDFSNWEDNLELSGGFSHATGDFGFNGFNAAAGLWLDRHVSVNFDYDSVYKTSTLGVLSINQHWAHTDQEPHAGLVDWAENFLPTARTGQV